jgi:hypothetical protein
MAVWVKGESHRTRAAAGWSFLTPEVDALSHNVSQRSITLVGIINFATHRSV